MSRNERHLFVGVLLVLAAALAVMLVQNTLMSGQPAIRRVSVLLDGEDGAYWQNFRLGVDRAAREHSVDVRYITRYEGAAGAAQAELLRKEWEGELDGVILVPLDGVALSEALEEAPAGLAVAVAGPALPEVKNACSVSASPEEMGRRLADAVADGGVESCAVVRSGGESETERRRYQGLEEGLRAHGVRWETLTMDESSALPDLTGRAVVALEPAITEALCGTGGKVYGVGASTGILNALENGGAAALVVQSDYDAGYLSLMSLLAALDGEKPQDQVLACYTVTAENMFTDPIDQILFPVA